MHLIIDPITTNENKTETTKSESNWFSTFYTSKERLLKHSSTTDIKNNRQEGRDKIFSPLLPMIKELKGWHPGQGEISQLSSKVVQT